MSLNFPNRFIWLLIGAIILLLLQSGCQPIQLPTTVSPTTSEESARANLSTNLSTETTSPDGEWTATTLFQQARGSDNYSQSLVVTHASGSPSYTLVAATSPMGLGYTLPVAFAWSQDGERFYYTNRPNPDGCGILTNGSDLYQVDLTTGEIVEILPSNTTIGLGLSPDEQYVAYRAIGEPTLLIHDLDSNETSAFDLTPILGDDQVGAIVWSPDSSAFAFVVAHDPCIDGWAAATSIYLLDAKSLELTPVLEQDDRLLIPVAWPSVGTMLVENQLPYNQIDQQQQFTLDLATKNVTPTDGATITTTTPISQ